MRHDGLGQAGVPKPLQITDRGLAAGKHDDIRAGNLLGTAGPSHQHSGLAGQRLDVGGVRDPRQSHRRDPQPLGAVRWYRHTDEFTGHHRQRVLGIEPQLVAVGQHTVGRPAGERGQLLETGCQQSRVAPELVDDETGDECLILRREHRDGAENVTHDDDRQIRSPGQTHVRQIRCAQVDLGGRSRSLTQHHVEFGSQAREFLGDHPGQSIAVLDVVTRAHGAHRPPPHHQLGGAVAAGLEQDRVEAHAGRQAGCPGLHRLGAADLTADPVGAQRDHRVVAHVLRLERRNPDSLARQQPAQPGNHHGLSGVGRRSGDEQSAAGARRHGSVRISAPSSVTTMVCSNCAVHLRSVVATVQPSSQIS